MINIDQGFDPALLSRYLLAQAGVRWCDCDIQCSCFSFESLQIDIRMIVIKANGQEFKLATEKADLLFQLRAETGQHS